MMRWLVALVLLVLLSTLCDAKIPFNYKFTDGRTLDDFPNIPRDVLEEFPYPKYKYCDKDLTRQISCCKSRKDNCSEIIREYQATCYCDEFCLSKPHPDCCPDYLPYCLGVVNTDNAEQTSQEILNRCTLNGVLYELGDRVNHNCNLCTCIVSREETNTWVWDDVCTRHRCVVEKDLIDKVNNGRGLWRAAANYTDFWGMTLWDAGEKRVGSLFLDTSKVPQTNYLRRPVTNINYDLRDDQKKKIHAIMDQGNCNVSYAFSITATTSDLLAIHQGKLLDERFSPQAVISCLRWYYEDVNAAGQNNAGFCDARPVEDAGWYINNYGNMPANCFPYLGDKMKASADQLKRESRSRREKPVDWKKYCAQFKDLRDLTSTEDLVGEFDCYAGSSVRHSSKYYKSDPVVILGPSRYAAVTQTEKPLNQWLRAKQDAIKFEIKSVGPVIALFDVHEDFFMYESGIYEYTGDKFRRPESEKIKRLHSARILGWGVERINGEEVPYWICDNSWGTWWGEQGFFRIRRGANEANIEDVTLKIRTGQSLSHMNERLRLKKR